MTRMTIEALRAKLEGSGAASEVAQELLAELLRARSEEARLLRLEAEKDATIKALADASEKTLKTLRAWHKNKGEWWGCQRLLDAALRLAERLP